MTETLVERVAHVISQRPKLHVTPSHTEVLYSLIDDYPNGVDISLDPGVYEIGRTVVLPSFTRLAGCGSDTTVIRLSPNSNCHMFSNDTSTESENIMITDLGLDGCGEAQQRPPGLKALTFACAFYFKRAQSVIASNLRCRDIRQTAIHFNACIDIVVKEFQAFGLGWSGVSTSDASNIWVEAEVSDAGRDVMHSAIHMDGGIGVYVDAKVSNTTGNGIMLDSAFASLRHCVVKGIATGCKRGVSLSGSAKHALEKIFISGAFCHNRDAGVMVSNSSGVTIFRSQIKHNGGTGLLLQGRNGGNDVMSVDSDISDNEVDVSEVHASRGNWVFPVSAATVSPTEGPNRRSLREYLTSRTASASIRAVSGG